MKFISTLYEHLRYILRYKTDWFAAATIVGIGFSIFLFGSKEALEKFNNIGSILQTAGVAATVYFSASVLSRDRMNTLPKRLTVIFEYQGQEVIRCEQAYLAGESDIRQWGQQIGFQMNKKLQLNFEPYIEEIEKGIYRDENNKEFKLYEVLFHLREHPEGIECGTLKKWERDANNRLKSVATLKSPPSVSKPQKGGRTRAKLILPSKS